MLMANRIKASITNSSAAVIVSVVIMGQDLFVKNGSTVILVGQFKVSEVGRRLPAASREVGRPLENYFIQNKQLIV
jgi:hypothetical protein